MTTSSTYLIEKFPTYFVGTGSAAAAFARKIRRHCFKFQAQVGAELPQLVKPARPRKTRDFYQAAKDRGAWRSTDHHQSDGNRASPPPAMLFV
ncbi:hypothetical protein MGG_15856 [Pyricularia oryzae 70-15]|uniref:Uncharacterized protein n=1 Tax=Pyricularia oryzae (strain 70-15 / ATCC MYA-4617 / FGSC 8958) TaxID=242507 RepID=G4MSR6_PYRO7|nr:uncharacterized protein MGG_15856 [Pyricularia oryzae 70-15]EHA55487.1 hypothetical protein MGG_15856 [Pyricularia oryzae 70-15]